MRLDCLAPLNSDPHNIHRFCLTWLKKSDFFFFYLAYFYYYLQVLLHFLILFMDSTVLFQLPFSFIYNTLNKKVFHFQLNKLFPNEHEMFLSIFQFTPHKLNQVSISVLVSVSVLVSILILFLVGISFSNTNLKVRKRQGWLLGDKVEFRSSIFCILLLVIFGGVGELHAQEELDWIEFSRMVGRKQYVILSLMK